MRTTCGDSTEFADNKIEIKFQGMCQGSGATPAGWAVIEITCLKAHKKKGHGAHFVCPISNLQGHLAVILLVDDTDIVHMDMCEDPSV